MEESYSQYKEHESAVTALQEAIENLDVDMMVNVQGTNLY
jgi:hypothetical protein